MDSRKLSDRIMWFSMWATVSIASFGVAWFPMVYNLIKRRNEHFTRQEKLETLVLSKLRKTQSPQNDADSPKVQSSSKLNAVVWTAATVLIVPAFYIFYVLKRDLRKHEEHEHNFLVEVIELAKQSDLPLDVHGFTTTPNIAKGKYIALSVGSLGLAAAYWLYRIFNDYNSHFKMQWKNEDEMLRFLKAFDEKMS